MYLISDQALVDDIIANKVTGKEEMKYLTLFSVLFVGKYYSLLSVFARLSGASNLQIPEMFNLLAWTINIAIIVVGISLCYKVNKMGDDKDFIKRFIMLTIPVWIKLFLVSTVALIILIIIAMFSIKIFNVVTTSNWATVYMLLLTLVGYVIQVMYFLLLKKRFVQVAGTTPSN